MQLAAGAQTFLVPKAWQVSHGSSHGTLDEHVSYPEHADTEGLNPMAQNALGLRVIN